MLNEEQFKKVYIDYKIYSVIKLKDKYGFRIKLLFSDNTEENKQIGGFSKKSEAIKARDKVASELLNHTFVIETKIKFEKYIRYWLNDVMKPNIKYNSYMSYRNVIENYAIPFLGNFNLTQINIGHIQKFYNETAKKYESIAKMAKTIMETSMEYAKEKNLISVNPTNSISLPKKIKKNEHKTIIINENDTLNLEQIKVLINASKDTPIHLQILFAVLMGLRKQEINGLKYDDIDYINRKLYIQRQLGRKTEDSKENYNEKMLTKQEIKLKTYNSERILDIPDMIFEAILEEKQKYEKNRSRRQNDKTNPFYDGNYICCSNYGKPRGKDFHRKYYAKLLKDNNLPKIKFHDLRHTYTTLLLQNNYDLKAVSKLLGHSSTIITSNIYYDKNKIIIDCTDEMEKYISKVKPKKEDINNELIIENLDTNLIVQRFL